MQKNKNRLRYRIPPIGLRMVKSAVAVLLCFIIHAILGGKRDVMQSILAAIICIQSRMDYSARTGFERIAGTLIGAVFGYLIATLEQFLPGLFAFGRMPLYLLISFAVIPVIHTTVLLKLNNTAVMACVVMFAMTLGTVEGSPVLYALNRVLDTMIGILIAVMVNISELPRRRNNDILFVSGLDDTLLTMNDSLSPYSKIELNRMISQGAKFTVSTRRTPASLVEVLGEVDLQIPVIAMDGAVLYDIRQNRYLRVYVMSKETIDEVLSFFRLIQVNCFINSFLGDIPIIYYPKQMNEIEQEEYEHYRKSPYRHYVQEDFSGKFPMNREAVYLYAIMEQERAEEVYEMLCGQEFEKKLKVRLEAAKEFPGKTYLRIYNRNATKINMIEYLKEEIGADKIVTFGGPEGKYDIVIHNGDVNKVVKTMKQLYRPLLLGRRRKISRTGADLEAKKNKPDRRKFHK